MELCEPVAAQQWKGPSEANKRKSIISVDGFAPERGEVGTVVTVRGRGFSSRTQLLVGGRPVKPMRVQATAITFKVPAGYGDGAIVLRHPGVGRDVVVGRFTVAASMQISKFAPQRGIRGARVEISGSGFGRDVKVMMNGKPLTVNRSAPRRLVVTISADATSDYLTLVAKDGSRMRTPAMFSVQLPAPIITSMIPASGLPGTKVRISGSNFTAEDKVLYGKVELAIAGRGADYVEVVIPMSTRRAKTLTIQNSNGVVRSAQVFALEKAAQIKRIAPLLGKVGQRVEIYGTGFKNGDRVTLNGVPLSVVQLRPKQISAEIPTGTASGHLVIERGPMRVRSRQRFALTRAPVVTGFTPTGGRLGSRVTITGQHFTRKVNVYYGAKKLRIIKRQGDSTLVVTMPKKAKNEVFRVLTEGGQAHADRPFEIQLPPAVKGLTPKRGLPGTEVTFTGKNLNSVAELRLNGVALQIVSRVPGKLVAAIPPTASSGLITIVSFGVAKRTRLRFKVLPGPEIALVTPHSGVPGTEIVIEGNNLYPETEVFLGDRKLRIKQRETGRLVARVPNSTAVGKYALQLRASTSTSLSPQTFQVVAPAKILGFSPERAESGSKVTIRGVNFDMSTKVYWGKQLLQVLQVKNNGRSLLVRIPRAAVGASYLQVDSGGVRAQSRSMLEVVTPHRSKRRGGRR